MDAVGEGFIKSLAQPGGNVTGFGVMEFSIFGKFLETLKQIAPGTSRVAMIYNPDNPSAVQFRRLFESFALPLSVQPIISPIHSLADIERATEALAKQPILRPPKRLALPCRTRCSPPLTRSSSRPCFAAVHSVGLWHERAGATIDLLSPQCAVKRL